MNDECNNEIAPNQTKWNPAHTNNSSNRIEQKSNQKQKVIHKTEEAADEINVTLKMLRSRRWCLFVVVVVGFLWIILSNFIKKYITFPFRLLREIFRIFMKFEKP